MKVLDGKGKTLYVSSGENACSLVCTAEYKEGDMIVLESSQKNIHVWMQVDDAMGPALCYITDHVIYKIPFGEKRKKCVKNEKKYLHS